MTRRASGCRTWSPHSSARSTTRAPLGVGGQQRRLRTRSSSARRIAREPASLLAVVEDERRHRAGAEAQRCTVGLCATGMSSTRRYGQPLELRARARPAAHGCGARGRRRARRSSRAEHNPAACCSSSTSATPRPTSAPSRGGAGRALALRHRARVDRRRARRRAAQPARAARPRLRRPRRLDRLLDRAAAAPGVDGDGRALPRPRDARRRPGPADRDADPHRQPARDRRRPARQRGRRLRAGRRAVRGRRLRHGDHLRRRLAPRASTSAASSPRAWRSRWRR